MSQKNIIDISAWQESMDWEYIARSKDGDPNLRIDGVYIKATQGLNLYDSKCAEHTAGAISAGIVFGFYHFLSYTLKQYKAGEEVAFGRKQAEFFWEKIKKNPGQLPVAIDLENNDAATGVNAWERITALTMGRVLTIALACFNRLHELSGRYPAVYTGGWIAQYMKNFSAGYYWGPRYVDNTTPFYRFLTREEALKRPLPTPGPFGKIDLFQYGSTGIGYLFGTKSRAAWSKVDLNIAFMDDKEFAEFCGNACVPTIPADPTPEDDIPVVNTGSKFAMVIDDYLNLRAAPGTGSAIIGGAPKGAILDVLEWGTDSLGNKWIRCGYKQWACVNYCGIQRLQLSEVKNV